MAVALYSLHALRAQTNGTANVTSITLNTPTGTVSGDVSLGLIYLNTSNTAWLAFFVKGDVIHWLAGAS